MHGVCRQGGELPGMSNDPMRRGLPNGEPGFWPPGAEESAARPSRELKTADIERELTPLLPPTADISPKFLREYGPALLDTGDVVAGRYEVLGLLALGITGPIYRVRDRQAEKEQILEVVLPCVLRGRQAQSRLLKAVQGGRRLVHEGIPRVVDRAQDDSRGVTCLIMDGAGDRTLERVLAEEGDAVSPDRAIDIAGQVCRALAYAQRTTIHGNLVPQNILVRPDGSVGVINFGMDRVMAPKKRAAYRKALATAPYAAPEATQDGWGPDPRADVYSLGIILYQMLTGRLPEERPKPPSSFSPQVTSGLDRVVLTCIRRRPPRRFGSAAGLGAALDQAFEDKRPRRAVKGLAVVAVLLAAVLGFLNWSDRFPLRVSTWNALISQTIWGVDEAEVENERHGALQEWAKAQAVGAEDAAPFQVATASTLMGEAEQFREAGKYAAARQAFGKAREGFATAVSLTDRLQEARDQARREAEAARLEVERKGATALDDESFAQAAALESEATTMPGPKAAIDKYAEASELYAQILSQADTALQEAKSATKAAKRDAQTGRADHYAPEEMTQASALLEAAEHATGDLLTVLAKCEDARTGFESAARLAEERILAGMAACKAARQGAERARVDAVAAKADRLVPTLLGEGDKTQVQARLLEDRQEYEAASEAYGRAKRAYIKALAEAEQVQKPDVHQPGPTATTGSTYGREHYTITLPSEYQEGQIMTVPGTGEPEREYIWIVNGREVLRGIGKSELRQTMSKFGICRLRLIEKLDGQTVIDTEAQTRVVPEPVNSHTVSIGTTVTFPSGYHQYRQHEWRADGELVSTEPTLRYTFGALGTHRIECKRMYHVDPKERQYREYRRITWQVSVQ